MLVSRRVCVFNPDFPGDSELEPNIKYIRTPAGRNVVLHLQKLAGARKLSFEGIDLDEEHDSWDFWVTGPHPGLLECKFQRFDCSLLWIDLRISLYKRMKCFLHNERCFGLLDEFCAIVSNEVRFRDLVWSDERHIGEAEAAVASKASKPR